jgi:hypothetical protein
MNDAPFGGRDSVPELHGRIETGVTLAVLALLVIGCFVVMRPFLSAILLAVLFCFSTWGL